MSMNTDKINIESLKKALELRGELGEKVRSMLDSPGFKVLQAVFYNFVNDEKERDDFETLEDFRASRKAIKIIQGLFAELDNMVEDSTQAQSQLSKLIEDESLTPSILSLEGEGIDEDQLSDF